MLCLASSSFAQDAPPQPATEETSAKTAREWKFLWDNRPAVRYGDLLRIDFRTRVVSDVRRSDAALRENDKARFDIARRRVGVSGEIADVADFQIERELADARGWRDVYVNYRGLDRMNVQAGQFKLPFGLDENTSSTNLDFVYRSRAATLSPGRDPGVMAHGRIRALRYAAGVFTRDGDNGRDTGTPRTSSHLTAAGRLLVQPFRSSKSVFEDLQAGVAYTSSILGVWAMNNFYVYRPSGSTRYGFLPWDRDNAFQVADTSVMTRTNENVLVRRLLEYPDLRAYYLNALETCARVASQGGWLEQEIATRANLIRAAAYADDRKPFTNDAFESQIAFLQAFARNRPGFVLAEVARLRGNRSRRCAMTTL